MNPLLALAAKWRSDADRYERDDALRDDIIIHFRSSLRRMAHMARSVGAEMILVPLRPAAAAMIVSMTDIW